MALEISEFRRKLLVDKVSQKAINRAKYALTRSATAEPKPMIKNNEGCGLGAQLVRVCVS